MEEDLYEKRMKICRECPLYKWDNFYGPICNSSKYLSPDGDDASYFPKPGWIKGCGCKLKFKVANPRGKCHAGKW